MLYLSTPKTNKSYFKEEEEKKVYFLTSGEYHYVFDIDIVYKLQRIHYYIVRTNVVHVKLSL